MPNFEKIRTEEGNKVSPEVASEILKIAKEIPGLEKDLTDLSRILCHAENIDDFEKIVPVSNLEKENLNV